MNIIKIRDFNENDPPTGLGPKVERPAPEPAQPAEVRPGIVVGPDGKLSTNIPPPSAPPSPVIEAIAQGLGVPVWPFPHAPKPAADTLTADDEGTA